MDNVIGDNVGLSPAEAQKALYANLNEGIALSQKTDLVLYEGKQRATGNKFTWTMGQLMKGLEKADPWIISGTALMLENTRREFAGMDEATKIQNIGSFEKFAFPVIRAVYPNLIAQDLVSVQPLPNPTGQIFFLQFLYSKSKGGTTAGTDMLENPDSKYTSEEIVGEPLYTGDGATVAFTGAVADWKPIKPGTLKVTAGAVVGVDDGAGSITGAGIAAGLVDYAAGTIDITYSVAPIDTLAITTDYEYDSELNADLPELDLNLTSLPVVAEPRKLKAKWGMEAAQDFQSYHGMSAEAEIIGALAQELRFEIDQSIIDDLFAAVPAANIITDFDITPTATNISIDDHRRGFMHTLINGSTAIFKSTQRAEANWLVAGADVSAVIEALPQFEPGAGPSPATGRGVYRVGRIRGWPVYKSARMAVKSYMLGYRGQSMIEAGSIYSPYQLFYTTPTVMLDDFITRKGVATRGKFTIINSKFYAKGTISES